MKLLLTSNGITNQSIATALFELVGKKPEDTSVAFIPTAANIDMGDKDWFIADLVNLQKLHFKQIDIADISALPEAVWKKKLSDADVLFFEGGNCYHLMSWVRKSGLEQLLPKLLETKVYVGLSAGSMITNPDLSLKILQTIYEEDLDQTEEMKGLSYVPFHVLPHLNSQYFPRVNEQEIRKLSDGASGTLYALDDNSALKIVDGVVEVISEGEYIHLP